MVYWEILIRKHPQTQLIASLDGINAPEYHGAEIRCRQEMPMKAGATLMGMIILLGSSPALAQEAAPKSVMSKYFDDASHARFNRFAFSLAFGFGSISLSSYHQFVDQNIKVVGGLLDENPTSSLQINSEVAFRYYFPYYVLAQVGYGAVYNHVSAGVAGGVNTLSNHNLIMEVPILVGGYYPFIGRLYVYGALGPSIFFYPRCWWDLDPGNVPDFKADTGVGFTFLLGSDFMVTEALGIGLEFRYRYLNAGVLKEMKTEAYMQNPQGVPYEFDLSGVSLALVFRFYVT